MTSMLTGDSTNALADVKSLPFPQGWFSLGLSSDVKRGQVKPVRLAGRELVVFRTASGELGLLDAYCPHLGAHLGQGGTVSERGAVRCPFHGFEFDRGGACVATAYGSKPPPTAKLTPHPVQDRNGVVLAWFDPHGRPPGWEVPEVDLSTASAWATHHWVLTGHPQETSENSVDIGHFEQVHGYKAVRSNERAVAEGPVLRADYSFTRPLLSFGKRHLGPTLDIKVNVFGLGVSVVHATAREFGLSFKLLVLPTPIDAGTIDLRIALAVLTPDTKWWHRLLPRFISHGLMPGQLIKVYQREIEQDFEVWRHKKYAPRPALAAGDGPIGLYRQWSRQFYAPAP
ncbi:MAG: Rieske 2Fe-2S domain-containing protein [Myxococcaceae bacterium]|jgi:nitrite reductase/ring-hydroxylating ferredoxin subunit|nr:Rieske 2Fe-2S domain-containing protein [Myxococcaceae bacterium]